MGEPVTAVEKIKIQNLSVTYGDTSALKNVTLSVLENEILGVIGPANSGKTTFLRMLNRLNDLKGESRERATF